MPINATYEYSEAMKQLELAQTDEERLKALQQMLRTAPSHKGAEALRADIKKKIAKIKEKLQKQKKSKRGFSISIKKEGAASIALVGTTNTGKSTFLNKLTGAKAVVKDYGYTTKMPEVGIYDYKGIKLQIIEIPSIFENFNESEKGPAFISIIKQCDLIILFFNNPKEKELIDRELQNADINLPIIIYNSQENIGDLIWSRLPLIKVRTKQPGKNPDHPPIALPKLSTVSDLADHVHKDFIKHFKYARIWGKSAKFSGQRVGLEHKLKDDDIVELHLK